MPARPSRAGGYRAKEQKRWPFPARICDAAGTPRLLKNDSACGTLVSSLPGGSVAVETAFGGCYTQAQSGALLRPSCSPSLLARVALRKGLERLTLQSLRGSPEWSEVTARCTPEGSFSLAVSRDAAVPALSLDSLHLLRPRGGPCGPLSRNKVFVVFNFPLSACGTIVKEAGGHRIYENQLSAERRTLRASSGSITRDSDFFRLTIRCSYSAQEPLPVSLLVAVLPPPATVAQQGPLTLDMRIAGDETYSSYYGPLDYPVVKLLREPIPLEVRLLGRRDPALLLLLHACWASPSPSPLRSPQWPLLQNGSVTWAWGAGGDMP
ncbi:zona pellucida sperm-binding protein 4-like [Thamnophis elegans]|uniref:zona pellucida sperm-binding protein 4-like n=1 Tax=Thamnophis elegans TaxID=35005 RepID=UPI0013787DDB|nr:zona pellucida sperm-binding protein 4-like [Thamnophis elegans]